MKLKINYKNYRICKLLIITAISDLKIDFFEYKEIKSYLNKIWISFNLFLSLKEIYIKNIEKNNNLNEQEIFNEFEKVFNKLKKEITLEEQFELEETIFLIIYQGDWQFSDLELKIKNLFWGIKKVD